ncbi:hypothetical protein [Streptomyces sp. NPDC054756]
MLITTTDHGATAVITPSGNVDHNALPALLTAASSELPLTVTHLTWDFEHSGYIDVAGLHLLDQQRQAAASPVALSPSPDWARSHFTCSNWPTNCSPRCTGATFFPPVSPSLRPEARPARRPTTRPELHVEGLHSCTQMAWAKYHRTVAEILRPPDELMLFCGMSIGYEDTATQSPRTGRAPLGETLTFLDD